MRKILFGLILFSFACKVSFAHTQQHSASDQKQIHKLMQQNQDLTHDVAKLENEVNQLIHQQSFSKANATLTTDKSNDLRPHQAQTQNRPVKFTQGTAVTTSPYIGIRSTFEGYELITNLPSINQDLCLLKQRKILEDTLKSAGKPFPQHPLIELSGELTGQMTYQQPYLGGSNSDINLTGAELDTNIIITNWISGYMNFTYDDAPPSSGTGGRRVSNSNVFIDRAFFTVGNLNVTPFYFTLGQLNIPFGRYSGFMISSPLTKSIGKTKARALVIGYQEPAEQGINLQAYAFRGDSRPSNHQINQFGADINYEFKHDSLNGALGLGYIGNIADATGMQDNGGSLPEFAGFDSSSGGERLEHRVDGFDAYGKLAVSDFSFVTEVVGALKAFNSQDMTFNGKGAQPIAYNIEGAYHYNLFGKPSNFALGYDYTQDALALNLPKRRFTTSVNANIWRDTVTSLEYRHDENYHSSDSATGRISRTSTGAVATDGSLGHSRDLVTLQMEVYF